MLVADVTNILTGPLLPRWRGGISISLIVLLAVFLVIAVRQIGRFRIGIWQAMLAGAIIVLITGEISVQAALSAIDVDVMLFLFGMFVVGQALEESGYLRHIAYHYFKRARSVDTLILMILFGCGFAAAFLMNDTLAIIGTPIMLLLARRHVMNPKLLLLSLCFAVTIGSVFSPIGNPQNLLIAMSGQFGNPFIDYARWLLLPTVANLLIAYWLLKRQYRDDFHDAQLAHSHEPIRDHWLALLSRWSLRIVGVLIVVKILTVATLPSLDFRLTYIALAAAFPILVGSRKRWDILRRIDWQTLVFFASMFVLMESVWQTGVVQRLLNSSRIDIRSVSVILGVSVVLSQVISNVPLVALIKPLLLHAGAGPRELIALAAGSTIAGNLFILGAASNVIVIQYAERRSHYTITFREFAAVGAPLTLLNVAVYWIFIQFIHF